MSRDRHGSRLFRVREMLGFSQREMAQALQVAPGTIALWEAGKRKVPGPVLKLLSLYESELGMETPAPLNETLLTSWWSRNAKLTTTAASVAPELLKAALKSGLSASDPDSNSVVMEARAALARKMVDSLGELKGFSMKIGQMLGYLDFTAPDKIRESYALLHTQASPFPDHQVSQVLEDELGRFPRQIFEHWERTPFAFGSIGQVHQARLSNGENVVVKVQYPGIERALRSDLKNLRALDSLLGLLFRGVEKGAIASELSDRILEECDYRIELKNQQRFRLLLQSKSAVIARVYPEYSSRRVLTMERIEGQPFAEFVKTATQAERDRAGETIFDFTFLSIFKHHLFNCDPHPGNYLFRDGQVVFLDFGCVKRFDPSTVHRLARLFEATTRGDRESFRQAVIEVGFVLDPARFDFDYCFRMLRTLYEPWIGDGPYQFGPEYVLRTWRSHMAENPNRHKIGLPRDWVFLTRVQWGLCAVLARLEARSRWGERLKSLARGALT